MTHQPEQQSTPVPGGPMNDDALPVAGEDCPPVPPAERSRFSQWLASFGLGEFQNPLLTRARPPVSRQPRQS